MNQNNEHVFFDHNNMFISQYRLVTQDGDTYPMNTVQRVSYSQAREEGCLRVIAIMILSVLILIGIILLVWGFSIVATFDYVEYSRGYPTDNTGRQIRGISLTILGLATAPTSIFLVIKLWRGRKVRHYANFTFVGSALPLVIDRGTTYTAAAHYAVWSYDEEWIKNLIDAANNAILASQQR